MQDEIDKMYERITELEEVAIDRLTESCTNLIEYLDKDEQEEYLKLVKDCADWVKKDDR